MIFAKSGYRVTGVDRSAESIEKARAKIEGLPAGSLDFLTAEIQSLKMDRRFDAVVSLFHVMSYLTADDDLASAFEAARHHLNPGGLFIFDCWYGPAVLADPPAVRVKRVGDEAVDVIRIAEPEVFPNENIVKVNYQVLVHHKASEKTMQVVERHSMRYWFKPEVNRMLLAAGFEPVDCMAWMTGGRPGRDTWNVCFIAKRRDKGGG